MRIVVLTTPHHLYANVVLNALVEARPGQVVAGFESTALLPGRTFVGALRRYLAVAGPRYVAAQAVKQWAFRLGRAAATVTRRASAPHVFHDWRRAATAHGCAIRPLRDVNDPPFLTYLHSKKPDLLLSVFFNQLLQPAALGAAARVWNLHPAPLPHGRGVSPTFWAMARSEPEAGVTWHAMTAEVDAGPVVAQERFPTAGYRTEHALYMEAARRGARLLLALLDALERGEEPAPVPATGLALSYDSLPTRAAYRDLRARGAGLYTPGELIRP